MIYWSIIPLEAAFAGWDDPANERPIETIEYHGVQMEVTAIGFRKARIHRLLSPIPADYLRPELAPGQIITL